MRSLKRKRRRRKNKDNHKQLLYSPVKMTGPPGETPGQQIRQLCWGRETQPQVQGAETAPQAQHIS